MRSATHRQIGLFLTLTCASALTLCVDGCSSPGKGRKAARVEINSLKVTTNLNGQPVLFDVLQTEVMRFADNYAVNVAQAVDDYLVRSTDADARLEAVKWKLAQATAAFVDATGPNPALNALDLVVLAAVSRMVMEDEAERFFGPESLPWLEVHRKLEANAWLAVSRAIKPEQQNELKDLIQEWRRQNPNLRYVGATRLRELASAIGKTPQAMSTRPNSIFRFLFLDPLAGLDPTAEAIAETRQFAERALYYSQRMPGLLNWQVQLLSLQLAQQPEIRQMLTNSERLTRSTEAFAQLSHQLPTLLEEQRQAGIQQVIDGFASERTNWLAELDARGQGTARLLGEARQTLVSAGDAAASIQEATKSVHELARFLSTFSSNNAAGASTPRDFDVLEYRDAASQISSAARDLNTLVVTLNQTAPGLNRQITSAGNQVVERMFWFALLWLCALLLGLVLAGIAFEAFRRKMRPSAHGISSANSIHEQLGNHRATLLP